jgi:thioredoxin reductase
MVTSLSADKTLKAVNRQGVLDITAGAVVLAMGCRERTRGAAMIPGDRPAGVFTAGTAQRYINIEGYMVGKKVIILGAGDIGMIMARRIVLEGGEVIAVLNRGSIVKGLTRNIVQCLDHYGIPLLLNHNITKIHGKDRVERVTVTQTDERKQPIPGTERDYECDTVLLSVGLIPENELSLQAGVRIDRQTGGPVVNESMETSVSGIFACGNVAHVHDVVDFVSEESARAGRNAARYARGELRNETDPVRITVSGGLSYCVPHTVRYSAMPERLDLFLRVEDVCPKARIALLHQGGELAGFKKTHLTPGEMIKLNISKSLLEHVRGDLEIRLETGG